jgi:hypothetical protein
MSASYRIHGIELSCHHCGSKDFTKLDARIGTVDKNLIDSFFGLSDQRSAEVFTCTSCGSVQWFVVTEPVETLPDEISCLECGKAVPCESTACPGCGWSWSLTRP